MRIGQLLEKLVENSLSGLEFMAGIPGTVGGAVRGNAGAWRKEIGYKISRVKILNSQNQIEWVEERLLFCLPRQPFQAKRRGNNYWKRSLRLRQKTGT
jgi:UDP-N-acetylmuramate dehydrogenase